MISNKSDRELRNLASMPITEEVLDELVEKRETPLHAAKDTAKEGKEKEKGHVAKNIMEASKASKEKVIKAAGKAKMNIRKRIDSERDPERQSSRGQLIRADKAERDGGGGAERAVEMMTLSEKKKERAERKKELQLQTSSPPAMMTAAPVDAQAQGGMNGPKSSAPAAGVAMSNNGDAVYSGNNTAAAIESLEQVEALIKMKKLPAETVAIHSPESGTTLY